MNDRGGSWRSDDSRNDYGNQMNRESGAQDERAWDAQRYYGDERRSYEGSNYGGGGGRGYQELGWRDTGRGYREPIGGREDMGGREYGDQGRWYYGRDYDRGYREPMRGSGRAGYYEAPWRGGHSTGMEYGANWRGQGGYNQGPSYDEPWRGYGHGWGGGQTSRGQMQYPEYGYGDYGAGYESGRRAPSESRRTWGPSGHGEPFPGSRPNDDWRSEGNPYLQEWWGEERGPHAGRGPRGYQRSDERIREEVSDRLTQHGWMDASELEVEVHNGEVTLRGDVDSREQKRLAEDIAEDVHGVKDVHNELRVHEHREATASMQSQGTTGGQTDMSQPSTTTARNNRIAAGSRQ